MSKVLFFSYPFHGHVNPTLSLVNELIRSGEMVYYYSDEAFRQKIEGAGAVFYSYRGALTPDYESADTPEPEGRVEGIDVLFRMAAGFLAGSRKVIDVIYGDVLKAQPDYIIHDTYAFWGKMLAQMLNIPAISVVTNFTVNDRMIDVAPDFFIGKVLRMADNRLFSKYSQGISRRLIDVVSANLGRMFGIRDFNLIDAFSGCEELNIVYTTRQFQPYEETFDDSYKFVGPCICPREEAAEFPFEELKDGPLLYISMGTVFNDRTDFYKMCFEAFGDTEFNVIMSVGRKIAISDLGLIPSNFMVRNFVLQLEVLQRARLFITHGGANSIHEGLYYHVPLVVIPQAVDQFLGGEMVQRLGAGICLDNGDITSGMLKEAAYKVYSGSSFSENSRLAGQSFRSAGGAQRAAEEIMRFMETKKAGK